MNAWEFILTVAACTAVVVLLRLLPNIGGTLHWLLSGETGGLSVDGFLSPTGRANRSLELRAALAHLSLITRMNMPLCAALEAAAHSESPRIGKILKEMSQSIAAGLPVSAALEAAINGCPDQLLAALKRAEACGQLPQAVAEQQRMIDGAIDAGTNSTNHARQAALYTSILVLFTVAIVSGIMVVVMPKFREIFADYGAPLPRTTVALIDAMQALATYGVWVLPLGLLVALCLAIVCVQARKGEQRGAIERMVAAMRWALPITRTMDYGLGMAKAIRSIALELRCGTATAFGATLPAVVSTSNHVHHALTQFSQAVADGIAPHQAASDAKLGDVFVSALKMVEHGEDPDRVLGHAADYYEAIAYRWWHALAALSGPLTTLAMGFVVGFIALALFLPLIALINAAAEAI